MVIAGIDLGASAIKIVFINEKFDLVWSKIMSAVPDNIETVKHSIEEGKKILSLSGEDFGGTAMTGYGKCFFPGSGITVDEITALGKAACHFSKGQAKVILNIGGQDTKIIRLGNDGKVHDFKMNDKCAAGTGRFLEVVARILNIGVDRLNEFDKPLNPAVAINSTCAVFAETEITSLLYKKVDKDSILWGAYRAIAGRIYDFAQGFSLDEDLYCDGGPVRNKGLLLALEEKFMKKTRTLPYPQLTTAIGAAMVLLQKRNVNKIAPF